MKETKRKIGVGLILVMAAAMLTGCAGFSKRAAFKEYGESLNEDQAAMSDLSEAMQQINKNPNDLTTAKAVIQAKVIPQLDTLSKNAQTRNQGITDTEIAAFDKHYVNAMDKLHEGFVLMLDGINNSDMTKLQAGNNAITLANNEIIEWVNGIDRFMTDNNIKDDGTIAAVKKSLQ